MAQGSGDQNESKKASKAGAEHATEQKPAEQTGDGSGTEARGSHGRTGGSTGLREARPAGHVPADQELVELDVEDETAKVAFEGESDASVVRRASYATDNVAIVSRTSTGEAHQHRGFGAVTVSEGQELSEAEAAAVENRPEQG